ncbi:MAG TPA: pantoate--beta-alanine ligase [Candidatus Limnocylindria bacterium]|nr:pantoate--beta-alanine ligase [Candidatus Limnocylindria bacterium]
MKVLRTVTAVREWRASAGAVGLVPTRGALHAGHAALVDRAIRQNEAAIVSIVADEDPDLRSSSEQADLALLEAHGAAAAFIPAREDLHPAHGTHVTPGTLAEPLEGAARPGHLVAVATRIVQLLGIVAPDLAYCGQKDFQELRVIQALARDLRLATRIIGCPTVRDPSGLALSSRNVALTEAQRTNASALSRGLMEAEHAFEAGETDADDLRSLVRSELEIWGLAAEYVSCADPVTLQELSGPVERAVVSLAAQIGTVRLIDNALLGIRLQDLDELQ